MNLKYFRLSCNVLTYCNYVRYSIHIMDSGAAGAASGWKMADLQTENQNTFSIYVTKVLLLVIIEMKRI